MLICQTLHDILQICMVEIFAEQFSLFQSNCEIIIKIPLSSLPAVHTVHCVAGQENMVASFYVLHVMP